MANQLTKASNFPAGFNNITLRGIPITQAHPGQVYWVSNASTSVLPGQIGSSDGNPGTFNAPFSTLNYALSRCTASRGDIIFVKPGHAETVSSATALAFSTAGVAIIGLGVGTSRPTFTLDTGNTTTITVSANDMSIQNCVFVANFLNIAALFTLTTAKNFTFENCETKDTSAILNFANIITTSATSNANDNLGVIGSKFSLLHATAAANLLKVTGTQDGIYVADNLYLSTTTDAGAVIVVSAAKVMTNFYLLRNVFTLVNAAATATGYLITSAQAGSTGMIHDNTDFCLANTTYLSSLAVTAGTGLRFGINRHSRTADKSSGAVLPAADA